MPQRVWTPPPLTQLRAFETSARMLSFTAAAIELNQTQGAVSHQVNALSKARLGVKLFEREPRGLKLTEAGGRYLPLVRICSSDCGQRRYRSVWNAPPFSR